MKPTTGSYSVKIIFECFDKNNGQRSPIANVKLEELKEHEQPTKSEELYVIVHAVALGDRVGRINVPIMTYTHFVEWIQKSDLTAIALAVEEKGEKVDV